MTCRSISWAAMLILCSCSSPRYTYFFNQQPATVSEIKPVMITEETITPPAAEQFFASSSPAVSPTVHMPAPVVKPINGSVEKSSTLTEKKTDNAKSIVAKGRMDVNLKRSIMFGASGIVALIIGGHLFFVLGSLSLLIGLIFGIKWLLRQ